MATLDVLHKPPFTPGAKRARRGPRKPMPLPMIGLGLVVVLSVGFGAGSLIQFDQDWRGAAPLALASVSTVGTSDDLAGTVTAALAGTDVPVAQVTCNQPQRATDTVLCHARSDQGMVSIVAQPQSGEQVRVTVFLGR